MYISLHGFKSCNIHVVKNLLNNDKQDTTIKTTCASAAGAVFSASIGVGVSVAAEASTSVLPFSAKIYLVIHFWHA